MAPCYIFSHPLPSLPVRGGSDGYLFVAPNASPLFLTILGNLFALQFLLTDMRSTADVVFLTCSFLGHSEYSELVPHELRSDFDEYRVDVSDLASPRLLIEVFLKTGSTFLLP